MRESCKGHLSDAHDLNRIYGEPEPILLLEGGWRATVLSAGQETTCAPDCIALTLAQNRQSNYIPSSRCSANRCCQISRSSKRLSTPNVRGRRAAVSRGVCVCNKRRDRKSSLRFCTVYVALRRSYARAPAWLLSLRKIKKKWLRRNRYGTGLEDWRRDCDGSRDAYSKRKGYYFYYNFFFRTLLLSLPLRNERNAAALRVRNRSKLV